MKNNFFCRNSVSRNNPEMYIPILKWPCKKIPFYVIIYFRLICLMVLEHFPLALEITVRTQKVKILATFYQDQQIISTFISLSFHLYSTKVTFQHLQSSLSCRAASTDIADPLSPLLPIVHRLWQVFRATSRILTQLLYVCSSWSSCFCLAICWGP